MLINPLFQVRMFCVGGSEKPGVVFPSFRIFTGSTKLDGDAIGKTDVSGRENHPFVLE